MAYPALFLRIKSLFLDSTALGVIFFSLVLICIKFGITSSELKASIILIPTILFEPLMIRLTGGSLGHHYSGIKIIDEKTGGNLSVARGIIRFIVKSVFGALSFLTMLITKKNRAIHDAASRSLVLFKDEATAPAHHVLPIRNMNYLKEKPSIGRRLSVSAIYSLFLIIGLSIAMDIFVSPSCWRYDECSETESESIIYFSLIFWILSAAIFALGFICKLPGAYHRAKKSI